MEAGILVASDTFEHYMRQINRFALLSREEEYELARRYRQDGNLQAAHRLICGNLRFVVKIAQEYRAYGMKMLDLIQEGNIGLMLAVKKFEPEKGIRLISYAVWWIRAYIQNFIIRSWSLVKIGTTQAQKKLFYKLNQARAAVLQLTGQEDSAEIARELAVRDSDVEEMALRMAARDSSLDVELTEGEDYTLMDSLADSRESQEEQLLRQEQEQHSLAAGDHGPEPPERPGEMHHRVADSRRAAPHLAGTGGRFRCQPGTHPTAGKRCARESSQCCCHHWQSRPPRCSEAH